MGGVLQYNLLRLDQLRHHWIWKATIVVAHFPVWFHAPLQPESDVWEFN